MTVTNGWIPTQENDVLIAKPGEPALNITAFTARQKASGYFGANVSHLMGGEEPALVWSQSCLVWRVPIVLTSPLHGRLGVVGYVEVDARTGQLLLSADLIDQVELNAQALIADC